MLLLPYTRLKIRMPRTSDYALDVRIWDVAHGSAAYMRAGKKDVVLDCGASPEFSPLKWLNTSYYGMNSIDYLIISHPHEDHIEDLDMMKSLDLKPSDLIIQRPKQATELVEENLEKAKEEGREEFVKDAEYYLNVLDEIDGTPDVFPSNPEWAIDGVDAGQHLTDGGIPYNGVTIHNFNVGEIIGNDNYEKLNNLSRVTVTNCFGFSMVSAGDLLEDGIEQIKEDENAMSAIEDADVLIAPHHGRDSSFDRELVQHISPDLVVFSDKNADHTVSGKYGSEASGTFVLDEQSEERELRKVISTNSDGRIRVQANNESDWDVSIYGRDYASTKAATKRYQKAD